MYTHGISCSFLFVFVFVFVFALVFALVFIVVFVIVFVFVFSLFASLHCMTWQGTQQQSYLLSRSQSQQSGIFLSDPLLRPLSFSMSLFPNATAI